MRSVIVRPKVTILDPVGHFRRQPTRPVDYQGEDFAENFDYYTLFFDALFLADRVILLGPPFNNLLPHVEQMTLTALPSRQPCTFRIKAMDRHSQIWTSVPTGTIKLIIDSALGKFEVTPDANQPDWFQGARVLFTLSKNNRLEWIQDWLRYNRDVHGADAILFYDNQSTEYSNDRLLEALSAVSGFTQICVVSWPFKYGPQGLGATGFWDSDFCQIGALEHARWKFLQRARSVLNSDIDELTVSLKGRSIFEAVEHTKAGVIRFYGVWVHGFSDRVVVTPQQHHVRYVDFDHFRRPPAKRKYRLFPIFRGDCPPKWAMVPRRCPEGAQWTAHSINEWREAGATDGEFCYRHYREINDHWKYDRSKRERFDPRQYIYDDAMISNFDRVNWAS